MTSVMPERWMSRTMIDGELHLALGQARHRLIEQQDFRFGGERARDFEPLAAGRAERACRRIRQCAEADALQHRARLGLGLRSMRRAQKRADHDVLEHRHAFERLRHLEGAREPEMRAGFRGQIGDVVAFEQNLAGGRQQIAGQAIEQAWICRRRSARSGPGYRPAPASPRRCRRP